MSQYIYQPLSNDGLRRIRLLTLEPGEFSDDIVVSLDIKLFSGDHLPYYEALSYVWGSQGDPVSIHVKDSPPTGPDGGCLLITQNLDCALRHLRYPNQTRLMWIDSICIDQLNDEEKGPQVAMMGNIFQHAAGVLMWLGPEADNSSDAMEMLRYLGIRVEINFFLFTAHVSPTCTDQVLLDGVLPFDEESQRIILNLLLRPYFDRLWIRQEITLAVPQRVVTICGKSTMPWPTFRNALGAIYLLAGIPQEDRSFAEAYNSRVNNLRGFIFQYLGVPVAAIGNVFKYAECSDERDRIYAVLALMDTVGKKMDIVPDYTRAFTDVFRDVAIKYTQLCMMLDIMKQCHIDHDFHPSWVPDWSKRSPTMSTIQPPFSATSRAMAWIQIPDPQVLRVTGVKVSTIRRLHSHSSKIDPDNTKHYEPTLEGFILILKWLKRILHVQNLHAEYLGGHSVLDAYADTLIFGRFSENFVPQVAGYPVLSEFKSLLTRIAMMDDEEFEYLEWSTAERWVLEEILSCATGRQFFEGTEGFIGMVPSSAQEGDEIYVLLGLNVPLVVRPVEEGRFRVVGEAYVPGTSKGEILFGPLPEGIQAIGVTSEGTYHFGFKNQHTGDVSFEDPRFRSLPINPTENRGKTSSDKGSGIYIEPDILRQKGVDLRHLDLI